MSATFIETRKAPLLSKNQPAFSELTLHGLTDYQLARSETNQLVEYLQENEHIRGAVHGYVAEAGSVLLVATDERLLYLHDAPSYSNLEEISYDVIEGLTVNRSNRLLTTVCVHTKFKTYQLDYVNPRQAEIFVTHLQSHMPSAPHPMVNLESICSA